jgi:hypothetical protein
MTLQVIENLRAIQDEYNRRLESAIEDLRPQFHEIFKPFLDKYPFVENLNFTAYTPYFMDGDECIYSVNSLHAYGEELEDDYGGIDLNYPGSIYTDLLAIAEGREPGQSWVPRDYTSVTEYLTKRYADELARGADWLRQVSEMLEEGANYNGLLHEIPDDVIRGLFGDHVKVTITREGVTTDHYDHD